MFALPNHTARDESTNNDKNDDGQNLDHTEPVFSFTISTSTEKIKDKDNNEPHERPYIDYVKCTEFGSANV